MGGNALKRTITFRKSLKDYLEIKEDMLSILKYYGFECCGLLEIPNKETFGDLDILYIPKFELNIVEIISILKPNEIVKNGSVISFDFRDFQIDLIETNNLEMSSFYFSYGDLGSILGRITNAYGLKFGDKGLWLNLFKNTIYPSIQLSQTDTIGKIRLCDNPKDICKFLGLDFTKYSNGFENLEDIYKWIINSNLFNSDIFKTLNYHHRKRLEKRVMYIGFLDYIGLNKECISKTLENHSGEIIRNLQKYAIEYFDREDCLKNILMDIKEKEIIKEKFNGKLFLDSGIPQNLLGNVIKYFKEYIVEKYGFSFEKWLKTNSIDNIQKVIRFYCSFVLQKIK